MAFNPELSKQFINFILHELSVLIEIEDRYYNPREIAAAMIKQVEASGNDVHGLREETLESATRRVGLTLSHQHKEKLITRLQRNRRTDNKTLGGCYVYYYQTAEEKEHA